MNIWAGHQTSPLRTDCRLHHHMVTNPLTCGICFSAKTWSYINAFHILPPQINVADYWNSILRETRISTLLTLSQYHYRWWLSDARSQAINRHCIDSYSRLYQFQHQRGYHIDTRTKWPPISGILTFSNAFSCLKITVFQSKFQGCLALMVQLISQQLFGLDLYANTGPKPTEHTVYILPVVLSKSTLFQPHKHANMCHH